MRPSFESLCVDPPYESEIGNQVNGESSSFANLLEQLGREHDREVKQLHSEIMRLSEGGTPLSCTPSMTTRAKRKSQVAFQEEEEIRNSTDSLIDLRIEDVFSESFPAGLCTSQVETILVDTDSDEEVPDERDAFQKDYDAMSRASPQYSSDRSNLSNAGPTAGHQSSAHFEVQDDDDFNRPIMARRTSSSSALTHCTHVSDLTHFTTGSNFLSQANLDKPMQGWHNLIALAQAELDGVHCVQVDPVWSTGKNNGNAGVAGVESSDIRSLWTSALLSRTFSDLSETLENSRQRSLRHDSTLVKFAKKLQKRIVLHPNSLSRVVWDLAGTLLLMHDFVLIPLQVFDVGTSGLGDEYMGFWRYLDTSALVFWTFDIVVSFLTSYFTELGFVEAQIYRIALNYVKSWFALDFLIVAIDWIGYVLHFNSEFGYLRLGKTASRLIRILRLLRLSKLNEKISKMLERINSEYIVTLVGVLKLLFGIIMVNHYIACTWYYLSQAQSAKTWSKIHLVEQNEMGYAYTTSLHWSLTQFTPASMEVHATNTYERIYTIVVIIAAMVTFSSFVSSITGAMTHLRHINAKKAEQDTAFRQYFSSNKISQELASQVWHFRRHNAKRNKSRMKEVDLPAFADLPDRMQAMLRVEVYSPILQQHPFFALYAEICPEAMKQICHQAMCERHILAGEELKDLSSPPNRMLFVCSGILEYLCEEESQRVSISRIIEERMTKITGNGKGNGFNGSSNSTLFSHGRCCSRFKIFGGQWACEVSLWSNTSRTSGPFVGGDPGCELVFLDKDKFKICALRHKDGARLIAKYALTFVQRFNHSSLNPDFSNILFNDQDLITDIVEESTAELLNNRDQKGTSSIMLPRLSKARSSSNRRSSRKSVCSNKFEAFGRMNSIAGWMRQIR